MSSDGPTRHPLDLEDVWYTWVKPKGRPAPLQRQPPNFSARHWRFFSAVSEIREQLGSEVEVDVEDPLAPTVHFSLRHDEYWLRIECAPDADAPPELQGAFIAGFEYEWNGKKRLADLVKEYYDYASRIDEAIGHIKEIEAHEVKLIGYDLADGMEGGEEGSHNEEEESGDGGVCLRVRLKVAGGVGEVRLRVAVEDPLAYPRAITMVERSELLRELKMSYASKAEVVIGKVATAAADAAAEVHSIPCKTNYTGPAPVEAYLLREKRDEDRERTALRGRRLEGVKMQLPEGFSCSLLQEKGAGRLDQVVSGASLVFWEHDRDPSERSTLHRALAHLHVAAALAAPAAE